MRSTAGSVSFRAVCSMPMRAGCRAPGSITMRRFVCRFLRARRARISSYIEKRYPDGLPMHIRTPPHICNCDAPGFNPCLHAATGTRPVAGFVFNLAATNEILLCVCYLCLMTQPLQEPRVMPQAVTAVFRPIRSDRPIWAVRDPCGKQATTHARPVSTKAPPCLCPTSCASRATPTTRA